MLSRNAKERQVGIPWNVPLSHGTVRWDGQFTAFLDIYENINLPEWKSIVYCLLDITVNIQG